MNAGEQHIPVMLNEVLNYFEVKKNGVYVDCTFGTGGHARAILEKLESGQLIAFEWDKKSAELVQGDDFFAPPKFSLINDNFANLTEHLKDFDDKEIDGFLFDLGLSSHQLFEENRGFSYRLDSPLDMRISEESSLTAMDVINKFSYEKLAKIFYWYGEERKARVIARKICYRREKEKINSTQQLVGIVASCFLRKKKKHPARKVFQALRIFINNELENLSQGLEAAIKYLAPGGKIIVISYHSLEDSRVKQLFKKYSLLGNFQIITKKPLIPSQKEINENHKSRSAKMRIIERIKI